ncbi:NDP-hexose 2,3-dehydratase family protein [Saccharopolyspora pogona]|uniref:NDP-hexose 2,3-dehydratase family protein n=1 Tax=Saccharopolyspora pogona TaxID=333966 RepID=UPI00295AA323|nr:NDP-hexose 2,3-dehydratase family protein [Saccharopolyspora pogona]
MPNAEFNCWLTDRLGENSFETTRIPFSALVNWKSEAATENLVHAEGRFFTVEGLQVETDYGAATCWHQPITIRSKWAFSSRRSTGCCTASCQPRCNRATSTTGR